MSDITGIHVKGFARSKITQQAHVTVDIYRGKDRTSVELRLSRLPTSPDDWRNLALDALETELGMPRLTLIARSVFPEGWGRPDLDTSSRS